MFYPYGYPWFSQQPSVSQPSASLPQHPVQGVPQPAVQPHASPRDSLKAFMMADQSVKHGSLQKKKMFTTLKGHMQVSLNFSTGRVGETSLSWKVVQDKINNQEYILCGICESTALFRSLQRLIKHRKESCHEIAIEPEISVPAVIDNMQPNDSFGLLVDEARSELENLNDVSLRNQFREIIGHSPSHSCTRVSLIDSIIGKLELEGNDTLNNSNNQMEGIEHETLKLVESVPNPKVEISNLSPFREVESEFALFVRKRGIEISRSFPSMTADQVSFAVLSEWERRLNHKIAAVNQVDESVDSSQSTAPSLKSMEPSLICTETAGPENQTETAVTKKPKNKVTKRSEVQVERKRKGFIVECGNCRACFPTDTRISETWFCLVCKDKWLKRLKLKYHVGDRVLCSKVSPGLFWPVIISIKEVGSSDDVNAYCVSFLWKKKERHQYVDESSLIEWNESEEGSSELKDAYIWVDQRFTKNDSQLTVNCDDL